MVGSLLVRGMLVGLIAGLLAFGFARVFGEPGVNYAIGVEEQKAAAAGEAPEPELVSRVTQSTIGLATGVMVFGAAIGGIFSLVFAYVYGRLGNLKARALSAWLAAGAFLALVVVPQIKYPASPPAVGNPETIGPRTQLFFAMIFLSIAILVCAVLLARRLTANLGPWTAGIVAALAYVVAIAIVQFALPTVQEVPPEFSAVMLWQFRLASIGIHVILWAIIGLGFGAAAEKLLESGHSRARALAA